MDIGQPGKIGANVVKHVVMELNPAKEHVRSHPPVTKEKHALVTVKKSRLVTKVFVKVIYIFLFFFFLFVILMFFLIFFLQDKICEGLRH